ncbi:MAG: pitrilysin family protein [Myxococcales bacterium]|nr:insulinase family protein [Polyangiaceae bacterium]MDW8250306.1 pitrilysin family protein [Myxococcales bacterium]
MGAEALERLNRGKAPGAQVQWVETLTWSKEHKVERYRLGNGLTLLLLVDHGAPVFSYQTWFSVGSRHERPGKTGLAHLFEHLMFNESKHLPKGEFDRKLEECGAESNAATWVDWTYYHENVPSDRLKLVVDLEAERMAHLVLREPQVTSEKEVVSNERRQRVEDDVDGSVAELLYKTAFQRHGYGWPTIGWMEDIQNFSTKDCEDFYRTYYAPNNATIVVVGDVDREELLSRVQRRYGAMEAAEIPVEDVRPEPPQTEERVVEVEKPTEVEKIAVGYRGPALGDADHVPLSVLNEILFGGRASRVHRAMVQEAEAAVDCRGWVSTFRDPGLYDITATARPGIRAEALLAILDRELGKVVEAPVDRTELERAKARMELSALHGMESCDGRAEQIGFYEVVTGDPVGALARLTPLRRVTVTDLLRVARRYLVKEARSVILVRAALARREAPLEGSVEDVTGERQISL